MVLVFQYKDYAIGPKDNGITSQGKRLEIHVSYMGLIFKSVFNRATLPSLISFMNIVLSFGPLEVSHYTI